MMTYSDFIFWGAILVLFGIFIYCCRMILSAFRTQSIDIAYAGSIHDQLPSSAKVNAKAIDIIKMQIKDKDYTDDLTPYVVEGNSMQYAHIRNGDIVLTQKSDLNNVDLPIVIVLKSKNGNDSNTVYKLRRAWKLISSDTDLLSFEKIIKEILSSDTFKDLKSLVKDKCPDETKLMNQIVEKYKVLDKAAKEDFVLSTTYRTKTQEIGFSLHKAKDVVGVVTYIAAKKSA